METSAAVVKSSGTEEIKSRNCESGGMSSASSVHGNISVKIAESTGTKIILSPSDAQLT